MRIKPRQALRLVARPGGVACLVGVGALGLLLLPAPAVDRLRACAAEVFAPGELAARFVAAPFASWVDAQRVALVERFAQRELETTVADLRAENERLRGALERTANAATEDASAEAAWAGGVLTPARLLDGRTRAALAGLARLDAGARQRLSPGLLTVDVAGDLEQMEMPSLQAGAAEGCAAGQPVLAGARVVGKLARVDRETSWLLSPTDPKYRDEVVIRAAERPAAAAGGSGILEGTGDGRCRVRMVSASLPVAVGDWVFPAGGEAIWRNPPSYGRVISAERPPGAMHWEIVVQPWERALPRVVNVVRAELRSPRMASARSARR